MKTSCFVVALLAFGIAGMPAAQTSTAAADAAKPGPTGVPAPTAYRVVDAGANHRVWQNETYEKSPDGQVYTHIHTVKELCSGLNFLKAGQWVESKEQIEVLPQGGAAAVQGQHQAYFPGDIYDGFIELVTPDGQHLKSRPLGLSYDDGNNTVFIAVLTNSVGQLVGSNQVIYPDAFIGFTGFKVDLRYTYTKAGFEQDIILREQPPTPESLGLNPATARLQVLTEFFSPPQPAIQARKLAAQAGLSLTDQSLGFGAMQMVPGRAFMLGQNATDAGATVSKQWLLLDGRQFLVEEVPVDAIADGLAALPLTAMQSGSSKASHTASRHLALPPQRLVKNTSKTMLLAKAGLPAQGFVLDYVTLNVNTNNFTFQGDTTYYISGSLNLSATNTFEGGAVLKYTNGASLNFVSVGAGAVQMLSTAYRPVIFTAKDDNSVGEIITGSTGTPTNYYAANALCLYGSTNSLHDLRFCYANTAIYAAGTVNLTNVQIVNCIYGVTESGTYLTVSINLRNVLMSNVHTNFNLNLYDSNASISAQNVTFANPTNSSVYTLISPAPYVSYWMYTTNCILANMNFSSVYSHLNGSYNGFYNSPVFGTSQVTNTFYPFQTVGAGSYYLAGGCAFTNAGTTNIDATLLAGLKQRTTYPPIVYANATISTNLILGLQAPRDTNAAPDLGYHYDPLDYVFGGCDLYTNLTLAAGTAVGWYEDYGSVYSSGQPYGISLNDGANFTSTGTATQPCWLARTMTVQEGGNGNWTGRGWMGEIMINGSGSGIVPQLNNQFTKWSTLAGDGNLFRDRWDHGKGTFSNCEFYIGGLATYDQSSLYFTNCLFFRDGIYFFDQSAALTFTFQNCTFYDGFIAMCRFTGQSSSFWTIKNTTFDGTGFSITDNFNGDTNYTAFDYNAYNTNNLSGLAYAYPYTPPPTNILEDVGTHDVFGGAYNWQSSWLGNFYLPSNSPLIDQGSTTAGQLGLAFFTTQTNQMMESNTVVDIGYHYVAVNTNGLPFTDTNGIPYYLQSGFDPDGSGLPIWWELLYFGQTGVDPNADPDGDGLTNLQEYILGTDPTVNEIAQFGSRLNYIYNLADWLNQVSGIKSGAVTLDNEGNVTQASQ